MRPRSKKQPSAAAGTAKREIPLRQDGQAYARVTAMLGGGRLRALCSDGVNRMCKIRGSMRRSEWISTGDLVLVSLRDFQDEKGDVLLKFLDQEARLLWKWKELPESLARATTVAEGAAGAEQQGEGGGGEDPGQNTIDFLHDSDDDIDAI